MSPVLEIPFVHHCKCPDLDYLVAKACLLGTLETAAVPLSIVHGWHDELIPADAVVAWAKAHQARICLVNDDHRLSQHVDFCAQQFALFLGSLL